MKRIDLVYDCIKKLDIGQGVTTNEISLELSLERSNVSKSLNKLVKENKLIKSSTRPVLYFIENGHNSIKPKSSLDKLSTLYPSLLSATKLARTAILYPPNGMNCLIAGDTGVGKSMLANLMYEYTLTLNPKEKIPFIHFNCSDYANNSQLLSAQLFGVKKGTFTGATEDRKGLIEEADGGFLFLDEIHNLSNEGQEMLFVYMDTGYFKPFGEVSKKVKSTARIICATNKNISESLLNTFIRRIPITIHLPSIAERSLEERLTLVESFLIDETAKLDLPVYISYNSMIALLSYECPFNIGQLKADIKLLVANSYSDYFINNKKYLKINSPDLPSNISISLSCSHPKEKELLDSLDHDGNYFIYSKDSSVTNHSKLKETYKLLNAFQNLLSNLCNILDQGNLNLDSANSLMKHYILCINECLPKHHFNFSNNVFSEIENKCKAEMKSLKVIFHNENLKNSFNLHLDLIYERIGILDFHVASTVNKLQGIFTEEFSEVNKLKETLEDTLNLNLSNYEFIVLLLFYLYGESTKE